MGYVEPKNTADYEREAKEAEVKGYIKFSLDKLTLQSLEAMLVVARALPKKENHSPIKKTSKNF